MSLVEIVRSAAERQVLGGREAMVRERRQVMELEESCFGAAPLGTHKSTAASVAAPDDTTH